MPELLTVLEVLELDEVPPPPLVVPLPLVPDVPRDPAEPLDVPEEAFPPVEVEATEAPDVLLSSRVLLPDEVGPAAVEFEDVAVSPCPVVPEEASRHDSPVPPREEPRQVDVTPGGRKHPTPSAPNVTSRSVATQPIFPRDEDGWGA